jgi:WD40 repeat protein
VLFAPDGKRLFAAGEDGTVQVWDTASGERVKSFRAHNLPVYGLALSPDGKLLVTCAGDWKAKSHGEISLWSAQTLDRVAKLPRQESPVWSAAFSRNGKQLYTAGGGLDVWDVATRKKLRRAAANQSIRCAVVSPDGRFVAAGTQFRPAGRTLIFETATWQEVASLGEHQKLILGMAYSPSGLLATASGDGSVILWRNQPEPATKRAAGSRAAGTPVPVK